jgi:Abnormal spindle-like microcephaly-assoc'd, ASPM-SPD-2-Hydin
MKKQLAFLNLFTPSFRGQVRQLFLVVVAVLVLAGNPQRAISAGSFSAVPTSAAFGNVPVGTRNTRIIQLKNELGKNVVISNITATGSGFSISGINTPTTLREGSTVQFTVAFLPASAGSVSGTMTVTESGGTKLVAVSLSGTGEASARELEVTPTSIAFGDVDVNASSVRDITLTNAGNSNISVSGMSSTGTALTQTGVSVGTTIEPGQTATVKVDFAPKVAGTLSGSVTITSNATNGTSIKVPVTGTAVAAPTNSTENVVLQWNASVSKGVSGYYVYRSTKSGGPYSQLDSSPTSSMSYTDSGVAAGTYFYVVAAIDSGKTSSYSNQVTVTVP